MTDTKLIENKYLTPHNIIIVLLIFIILLIIFKKDNFATKLNNGNAKIMANFNKTNPQAYKHNKIFY